MAIELCDYDCGFSATGQCVSCRTLICDRDSWLGQYLSEPDQYDGHQQLSWDLTGLEDSTRPWRMAELQERAAQLWERGNHCRQCVRAELEQVPAQHDAAETLAPEDLLNLVHTDDFRLIYADIGVDLAAQRIQDQLFDDPDFIPVVIAAIHARTGNAPVWWRDVLHSHREEDEETETFLLVEDDWKVFLATPDGGLTEYHTVVSSGRRRWLRARRPEAVTTATTVGWDDDALGRLWSELVYAWYPQLRPDRATPELPFEIAELATTYEMATPGTAPGIPAQPVSPVSPAVGIDLAVGADQSK